VKLKCEISNLALHDLDKIWLFTSEHWAKTQSNKYFKGIFKEIDLICKNPEIGKSIHEVKKEYRMKVFKSHFIIYKIKKDQIYIDRVLHQNMDIVNINDE